MSQTIGYIALLVRDYDEAIAFYTAALGFTVLEDVFEDLYGNKWDLLQLRNRGNSSENR